MRRGVILGKTIARAWLPANRLGTAFLRAGSTSSPFSLSASKPSVKKVDFGYVDTLPRRHIGPRDAELDRMLKVVGVSSLEELIDRTIPASIRLKKPMVLDSDAEGLKGEHQLLSEFKATMKENELFRSHLGAGYHDTITPGVILRNIMENPAWYTSYTPYQAEISQGRLEMLLNFQTMIADLTGLPIANASLLDEATAVAEGVFMCYSMVDRKKSTFYVADDVHPQTLAVVQTRAAPLGLTIETVKPSEFDFDNADLAGIVLQYPGTDGRAESYEEIAAKAKKAGAKVVVAADLLSLALLKPPGEWGADVVVGSAQRFGVPMGFGGPHAAFMATSDEHKRRIPGRIIGVSKDSRGKPALRMAMQTREQHIRRDKATSNICTAQALLANMAAAYGVYHGPEGLKQIATRVHALAKVFASGCTSLGLKIQHETFFDTVAVSTDSAQSLVDAAARKRINIRKLDDNTVTVAFDETNSLEHVQQLLDAFAKAVGAPAPRVKSLADAVDATIPESLRRTSSFMTHPVFNTHHSETEMLRYLYTLQTRDLSLATAMIPLGSCTMKLNATSEMIPVTWPEVNGLHPFAPPSQTAGYTKMLAELVRDLARITGFAAGQDMTRRMCMT